MGNELSISRKMQKDWWERGPTGRANVPGYKRSGVLSLGAVLSTLELIVNETENHVKGVFPNILKSLY